MSNKKNIFRAMIGLLSIIGLISILVLSSFYYQEKNCEGISVSLNQKTPFLFLDKNDIEDWVMQEQPLAVEQMKIKDINLFALEAKALSHPWIEEAEVFIDQHKELNIQVKQRVPKVRVFSRDGQSYYLDQDLKKLPLILGKNYPAPIVTNVPVLESEIKEQEMFKKIISLTEYIEKDAFWKSQIAQIEMNGRNEFDMVPMVGNHIIHFGGTDRIEEKFFNLKTFYKEVLNKVGWHKYEKIDLRFAGQVVTAPSLNKVAPKVDIVSFFDVDLPEEESDMPMETILQENTIETEELNPNIE